MSAEQTVSSTESFLIVFFRICLGWTFLWAGIHHFGDNNFVAGFLSHTKTFHDLYAPMTQPPIVGPLTVLVEYGHLLIGLSLISGLFVRASLPFALAMMALYWTAHMDFPYIENPNSLLIDFHVVYAGLAVYLYIKRAGHVFGLDAVAAKLSVVSHNPVLRWAAA